MSFDHDLASESVKSGGGVPRCGRGDLEQRLARSNMCK